MATTHTEIDIIKSVVKKRNFAQAYELLTKKGQAHAKELSSKQKQDERSSQNKQATKLWLQMCKLLKGQMDSEARIIDSLYFGTFAKASTVSGEDNKNYYVYCPGPKAVLKLVENEENLADLPQSLLDEKLTGLNIASLAESIGMTVETVTGILSGIRDEIVDLVVVKKQNAALNLNFGSLSLKAGGTVEFRSSSGLAIETDCAGMPDAEGNNSDKKTNCGQSSFSQKRQSEAFSRQSNAERSLTFMQQRQASQGAARSEIKSATTKHQTPASQYNDPIKLASDRKSGSANDLAPVKQNKLVFLNSFLKDQISTATNDRRAVSNTGQRKANQIIEEAAQMRAQGIKDEEMIDYVKNATAHYGTVFKTRSSGLAKVKVSDRDRAQDAEAAAKANAFDYSGDSELIFLTNRMTHTNKVGGYRRQGQSLDIGASHATKTPLKPTPLVKGAGNAMNESQNRDLQKTIHKALNRKQISQAYHTNMPVFLRSEGPFAMYDHSLRHVDPSAPHDAPTVVDQAALAALHRYENELVRLKELRESEKANFINSIEQQKHQMREAYKERGINQKQNQDFIQMQMDWSRTKRAEDKHHNKQYYKPHFGPEETQEIIAQMHETDQNKVDWQYNSLKNQLQDQANDSEARQNREAFMDAQRLHDTMAIQHAENEKRRYKELSSKACMRKAWMEQMAYKSAHKQTDNYFK